jgi:hypothetical protein
VLHVIGARHAGALSAGAVIAALQNGDAERRHEGEVAGAESRMPMEAAREVEVEPPPRVAVPASTTPTPPTKAPDPAAAPVTEHDEQPAEHEQGAHRRTRPERHERTTDQDDPALHLPGFGDAQQQQGSSGSQSASQGGPRTPADVLRDAQEALRQGHPQRCVQMLDDAIRQGAPAIVLRRRADCLEAAGQREAAVRDYQRFCRLVPDHPAIAEVRPLLESWGRSCP